jgi:hypothetical protein
VIVLVGKVERRPRMTRITQQMINKMDGRLEWQNAISEIGRKNYRKQSNVLNGTADNPRKYTLRTYLAR